MLKPNHKDWSPRSRTSNPCSRSPAARPQSPAQGKRFPAAAGDDGSGGPGSAPAGPRAGGRALPRRLTGGVRHVAIRSGKAADRRKTDSGAHPDRAATAPRLVSGAEDGAGCTHRASSCRRPPLDRAPRASLTSGHEGQRGAPTAPCRGLGPGQIEGLAPTVQPSDRPGRVTVSGKPSQATRSRPGR
jgi:hypothetical protein